MYLRNLIHKAIAWFKDSEHDGPVTISLVASHDALPPGREVTVDVVVLDVSISMSSNDYPPSRLNGAKAAACQFIERLAHAQPETIVIVIVFGSKAKLLSPPRRVGEEAKRLKRAVESAALDGSTNLGAGLALARRQIERVHPRHHPRVIVLTDGHSDSGCNSKSEAKKLKASGVQIDAIGIGGSPSDVDETQLRKIASVVNGETRYWFIRNVGELVRKFEALALREF